MDSKDYKELYEQTFAKNIQMQQTIAALVTKFGSYVPGAGSLVELPVKYLEDMTPYPIVGVNVDQDKQVIKIMRVHRIEGDTVGL